MWNHMKSRDGAEDSDDVQSRDHRPTLRPVTVTLSRDQQQRLDELAARLDRNRSWLVRRAISLMLADERTDAPAPSHRCDTSGPDTARPGWGHPRR